MKKVLLATVGALALCSAVTTMAWANTNGTLDVSYANITNSGGGDIWGVGGSVEGMFGSNWGGQLDGGYHNVSNGGGDIWNVGGSLFWATTSARIAATVNYHDLGGGVDFTNYGAGAEFYAGTDFTFAAHGGGVSGSGTSGGYVGGMAEWYATPNLALSGAVDYLDIGGSITTETVQGEWLISNNTPLSIFGGYQHADLGGSVDADIVFVGLKLYLNGNGAMSLTERQRQGSLGYITQSPLFLDQH
jgi:hypothetical protein